MSNLKPIENGYAETDTAGVFFVENFEGLRNLVAAQIEDCFFLNQEITDYSFELDVTTRDERDEVFPRLVLLSRESPCYNDACKEEDTRDTVSILWSFGLLDCIDLTAQFTLRGYS
jgi:hypothetical protein